jgi:hypothetical protein
MRHLCVVGCFVGLLFVSPSGAQRSPALSPHATAPPPRLVPMRFLAVAGWQIRTGAAHACLGASLSRCSQITTLASTSRWRDCLECAPHRTVGAMRADAIAIRITVGIERPSRVRPSFAWPPHVRRADVHRFEGLPGRIGVYQASTRVGTREVFLFVYFGQRRPTARQLQAANSELRRSSLG